MVSKNIFLSLSPTKVGFFLLKKQELLTVREHLGSPLVYGEIHDAILFSFLCCIFFLFVCLGFFLCLFCVLCSILPVFSGLSICDCPFTSVWCPIHGMHTHDICYYKDICPIFGILCDSHTWPMITVRLTLNISHQWNALSIWEKFDNYWNLVLVDLFKWMFKQIKELIVNILAYYYRVFRELSIYKFRGAVYDYSFGSFNLLVTSSF